MTKNNLFFKFDNIRLFWSNFFTILIFNFGNFLSMLFTFFIARNLIPSIYGEYITLSSIIAFMVTPIFFVSLFLSNKISQADDLNYRNEIINRVFQLSLIIMALVISVFYFSKGLIIEKFKIDNFEWIEIFGILILITLINHVFSGIFQGYKKYYHYSILSNITFLVKFIGVIICIYFFKLNLNIIFLTIFIAYFIQLIFTVFYINKITDLKKMFFLGRDFLNFDYILKSDWVFILLILFAYVINFFDILVFRYLYDIELSSNYNVSSLIAKIPLIAAASITNILVPELNDKNNLQIHKLGIAFIFITSIYIFYYMFILLFGDIFITIIFGNAYINSLEYINELVVYFYFCNLISVLLLALSKKISLNLIAIIVVYFVIILFLLVNFSVEPKNFINILTYSSSFFLVLILCIFLLKNTKKSA